MTNIINIILINIKYVFPQKIISPLAAYFHNIKKVLEFLPHNIY